MKLYFLTLLLVSSISLSAKCGELKVVKSTDRTQALMVIGQIDDQLNDHIRSPETYVKNFDPTKKTTLIYDNPGGQVAPAYSQPQLLGELADKVYQASGEPMEFVVLSSCSSACILVFTIFSDQSNSSEAVNIEVTDHARFGFHGASNMITGQWNAVQSDLYYRVLSIYANSVWTSKHQFMFMTTNLTYISAQDLVSQSSGIVREKHLQTFIEY